MEKIPANEWLDRQKLKGFNSEWQQDRLTDVLLYGDDDNERSGQRGPCYLEINTQ